MVLSISSEPLIQPDIIPPDHRDEVAEPHVRYFMCDSSRIALNQLCSRMLDWSQKHAAIKSNAAPVLHRSHIHAVQRDQV